VEASGIAACFFCLETFPPQAIDRWLNEGTGTAVCPQCQIDSVLGDASGLPVSEPGFLKAMQNRWFGHVAENET